MGQDKVLIALTKIQVVVAVVMSILVPTVTAVSATYSAYGNTNKVIDEHRLENYKTFVQKDELKEVRQKLEQMDGKLNRIEGYLSRNKSQ